MDSARQDADDQFQDRLSHGKAHPKEQPEQKISKCFLHGYAPLVSIFLAKFLISPVIFAVVASVVF